MYVPTNTTKLSMKTLGFSHRHRIHTSVPRRREVAVCFSPMSTVSHYKLQNMANNGKVAVLKRIRLPEDVIHSFHLDNLQKLMTITVS